MVGAEPKTQCRALQAVLETGAGVSCNQASRAGLAAPLPQSSRQAWHRHTHRRVEGCSRCIAKRVPIHCYKAAQSHCLAVISHRKDIIPESRHCAHLDPKTLDAPLAQLSMRLDAQLSNGCLGRMRSRPQTATAHTSASASHLPSAHIPWVQPAHALHQTGRQATRAPRAKPANTFFALQCTPLDPSVPNTPCVSPAPPLMEHGARPVRAENAISRRRDRCCSSKATCPEHNVHRQAPS